MSVTTMHPEQVRAQLRIQYGSLKGFAAARDVKDQLIRDYLRGQSSTAHVLIAAALGIEPDQLRVSRDSTNVERDSKARPSKHRLNARAR